MLRAEEASKTKGSSLFSRQRSRYLECDGVKKSLRRKGGKDRFAYFLSQFLQDHLRHLLVMLCRISWS